MEKSPSKDVFQKAAQNLRTLGPIQGISAMWYEVWYRQRVSPHLNKETKLKIAKRISELTLHSPIWLDREKNYIEDFPELKPYSSTGTISGMQLCAVMGAIIKDFGRVP